MVDEVVLKMQQESVNFTEEIKTLKQNHDQQYNNYSMKINELEVIFLRCLNICLKSHFPINCSNFQELIAEIKPFVDKCKHLEKEISDLEESKQTATHMLEDAKVNAADVVLIGLCYFVFFV
jgi:hemerythrin-like domain-containing protein